MPQWPARRIEGRGPIHTGQCSRFAAALAALVIAATGFDTAGAQPTPNPVNAIGVENEYADVISQIGGKYVDVAAIETDPNTDPHTFEISPKVATEIAAADLVVVNGIGYDDWADKIISAAPKANREVIDVQQLLNLPASTPNPHLWYDPKTMPIVAEAVAKGLATLRPAQAGYFEANARTFKASLGPWYAAIASFRKDFAGVPAAVTEPVGDDMLQATGIDIVTPFSLQAAIMNGTDPSPEDVMTQNGLLAGHKVKVLVYNQQVTDPLTQSFLNLAKRNGIPIVGVYETMPAPGYNYQSWMLAEVVALRNAVRDKISTEALQEGQK